MGMGAIALVYAMFCVAFFASGYFNLTIDPTIKPPMHPKPSWGAVIHIFLWTLGPPVWFFLEYWSIDNGKLIIQGYEEEAKKKLLLQSIRNYSDFAGKIWAAVLATIIFLYPK